MDTVTYPDPRVTQFIGQYTVPVKVPVRENPDLVGEYLVSWTPNVVLLDDEGRVLYRIEGYLPPEDFVAHLSIGMGKCGLQRKQYDRARERFEETAQRHHGTDAGAEALYWLGVARYKLAGDPAELRPAWEQLAQAYPSSEWTRRTQIPAVRQERG